MSDAFLLASKLHLSRDAYEQWLASPAPGPSSLTLSWVLSWAATDPWVVLLRFEQGVFRFVAMCAMGPVDTAEELVATLRSASAFKSAGVDWVLYWSEPSGLFAYLADTAGQAEPWAGTAFADANFVARARSGDG